MVAQKGLLVLSYQSSQEGTMKVVEMKDTLKMRK